LQENVVKVFLNFCFFRVSECAECKMPASNLAKVFGPTIVGYSATEAEPMKMFAETSKQAKVGHLLLKNHSTWYTVVTRY